MASWDRCRFVVVGLQRDLTACALWQQGQAKGAYKDAKHNL